MTTYSYSSRPAELFPVREHLEEELDARGITLGQFAVRLGWSFEALLPILDGDQPMPVRLAEAIGSHLGTSGIFWANLALSYRKWKGVVK